MAGETEFAQRLAELPLEGCLECRAIEGLGRFRPMGLQRPALNEQALAGEDRRQFVMARRKRLQLAANSEQLADEVFDMGGELDEERRFFLARRRRLARRIELVA